MKIDWAALASVFGVSLVVTVALVGVFTLGIVALSKLSAPADGTTPPHPAVRQHWRAPARTPPSRRAWRRSRTGSI